MRYALRAWLTFGARAAFILVAVLGGPEVVRRGRRAWLHLPAVVWAVFVECTATIGPLTAVESHLRTLAGAAA